MRIKKFDQLNERYKEPKNYKVNDFGFKVPEYTYTDNVFDRLVDIITRVNGISEKDFNNYDNTKNYIEMYFDNNQEILLEIDKFNQENKRTEYCAEYLYDKFFDIFYDMSINENKDFENVPKTKELKDKCTKSDCMKSLNGVSLGKTKSNKYFVYTHRARSKYYDKPEDISIKDIKFIETMKYLKSYKLFEYVSDNELEVANFFFDYFKIHYEKQILDLGFEKICGGLDPSKRITPRIGSGKSRTNPAVSIRYDKEYDYDPNKRFHEEKKDKNSRKMMEIANKDFNNIKNILGDFINTGIWVENVYEIEQGKVNVHFRLNHYMNINTYETQKWLADNSYFSKLIEWYNKGILDLDDKIPDEYPELMDSSDLGLL